MPRAQPSSARKTRLTTAKSMTALIPQASEAHRTSSLRTHENETVYGDKTSYGRGGAGNYGIPTHEFDRSVFETPTLKGDVFTTGRGGKGNMALNIDPVAARRAQDVDKHPIREYTSNAHVGRGGSANVFKPSAEEIEKVKKAKRTNLQWDSGVQGSGSCKESDNHPRGLADTGKNWLLSHIPSVENSKNAKNVKARHRKSMSQLDDNSSATLVPEKKKPVGFADKGKDWIFGHVESIFARRK